MGGHCEGEGYQGEQEERRGEYGGGGGGGGGWHSRGGVFR